MPTSKTAKSPTNFTEMQHANIVPVNINHIHHIIEKCSILFDDTFTPPNIDAIMKHNNKGSKRMYCVSVNNPTSRNLKPDKLITTTI